MPFPRVRKLFKRILRLLLIFAVLAVAGVSVFLWRCSCTAQPLKVLSDAAKERAKITSDIKGYSRGESSTYLGYPEWFIVWSYVERADFQARHLPSGFPWLRSIGQYWSSYCRVYGMTRGKYPFDFGEHQMLAVIGSSFSFEYFIRALYEGSVGRFAEWTAGGESTEEDVYSNRVAQEYAEFVRIRPFYEFSFWSRFKGFWSATKVWGRRPVRKLERRFFLSLDYSLQAFYCWLIEMATHASYGYEPSDTYAWIDHAPESVFTQNPRIRKVREVGAGAYIVIIPRYQEFTTVSEWLAQHDVHFVEIAGNDEILVTALAPSGLSYDPPVGKVAFEMPLAASPERKRIAVSVAVAELHRLIPHLETRGIKLEHLYDY